MRPGRYLPAMAALLFGAIAVPAHAATIQIVMDNLVISPAEISVKVGDTIEWINKDVFAHTATAPNGDFDVTIAPKKTVTSVLKKAGNKDVKAFAQDMVRDHEAVNKQALDLVKKLKVTPEDNDTSKALSKQATEKLAELAKLKGADYDKAYVANEVAYHKAVNGALETQLIPSANNAELKSLLQTGLKIFQGHQQHAEQVAAKLK